MLIQDMEHKTGLDRATIRFYEREGLVIPQREDNGYRIYCEEDLQLLLKIKLLRQLGVPLVKIKKLQQGNCDFSQILSDQIEALEHRIEGDTRARLVCIEMHKDGAEYSTLDSLHYLKMLGVPAAKLNNAYQEPVKRESHPWRRYFARMLDYRIIETLILFLIVVILRIRPFEENAVNILSFATYFLAVPIFAVMLCYTGTTPGKWVMGIRLENVNGGRLSGGEALYREGKIIWHGLGFFIPILTFWRMYRSYRDESEGTEQFWNEHTEIIYTKWSVGRKIVAVILVVISLGMSVFAAFDAMMPRYRREGITIAQFARNHQDYENIYDCRNEYYLGEDGTWQLRNDPSHGYYVIGEPNEKTRPNFQYELDKYGHISAITYANSWENGDFMDVIPHYCKSAVFAVVGSRPGSWAKDMDTVEKYLETELYEKLPEQEGSGSGSFIINDVTVSWKTEIENCDAVYQGMLFAIDNQNMSYSLQLRIEIE